MNKCGDSDYDNGGDVDNSCVDVPLWQVGDLAPVGNRKCCHDHTFLAAIPIFLPSAHAKHYKCNTTVSNHLWQRRASKRASHEKSKASSQNADSNGNNMCQDICTYVPVQTKNTQLEKRETVA